MYADIVGSTSLYETLGGAAAGCLDAVKLLITGHSGAIVTELGDEVMASETAKITHCAASNAKAEQTLGTSAVIDALPSRVALCRRRNLEFCFDRAS